MKKIMFLIITILMVLLNPMSSKAATNIQYTEDNIRDAGSLERLIEEEKKDREKILKSLNSFKFNEQYITYIQNLNKNNFNTNNTYSNGYTTYETDGRTGYYVGYNIYRQENIYWCGPASVKILLNILNGTSDTQSNYATRLGTGYGTNIYNMATLLNTDQSQNNYGVRILNYGQDENRIWETVLINFFGAHQPFPMIAQVNTKDLAIYHGKELAHFVTIIGYTGYPVYGIQTNKELAYADSFYGDYGNGDVFGEHWDSLTNFAKATKYLLW